MILLQQIWPGETWAHYFLTDPRSLAKPKYYYILKLLIFSLKIRLELLLDIQGVHELRQPTFSIKLVHLNLVFLKQVIYHFKAKLCSFISYTAKFSKIIISMSIDHNIVIKLHKSGESNSEIAKRLKMNHTTVWKIIKKFYEIGTTLDWEGRGRKRTVHAREKL